MPTLHFKGKKASVVLAVVSFLLTCCLTAGVASAESGSTYQDQVPTGPVPSGMPIFDNNFSMPTNMGDFNRTGIGGPDGGFPRNGTIPDGGNNMPDMSGAPSDMQPFNGQPQENTSADDTLIIVGIVIAVVITIVVVVVLKKRKPKPAPMVADQSVPPPTSEASATI